MFRSRWFHRILDTLLGAAVLLVMAGIVEHNAARAADVSPEHAHALEMAPHMQAVAIDVEQARIALYVDRKLVDEMAVVVRAFGGHCDSVQAALMAHDAFILKCNRSTTYVIREGTGLHGWLVWVAQ
jgi:hypothetical protein